MTMTHTTRDSFSLDIFAFGARCRAGGHYMGREQREEHSRRFLAGYDTADGLARLNAPVNPPGALDWPANLWDRDEHGRLL